jgi:hypothetical protein
LYSGARLDLGFCGSSKPVEGKLDENSKVVERVTLPVIFGGPCAVAVDDTEIDDRAPNSPATPSWLG